MITERETMIYREYETRFDDYDKKVEYRISITTDTFGAYSALKMAVEQIADQVEMPKEYVDAVFESMENKGGDTK